jgi:polysaccharide export outer membrane protein
MEVMQKIRMSPFALVPVLLFFLVLMGGLSRAQTDSSAPMQDSGQNTNATVSPAPAPDVAPPAENTPEAPLAPPPTPRPEASGTIPTDTTSSTYQLQPYDLIDVDVYSEEDLHKPARLGADGTVLLPLIGSVKLGGLTVADATEMVRQRYAAGYVKNPSVSITVLQYRKSTFSIMGQVERPGIYEIPEGANVNIIDALSLAGGYLPKAAQNDVTVKRTVDGQVETMKVKAADMAQDPNATPFEVLPGDTVMVPTAKYRNTGFSILGQVVKPGLYEIPDGGHLSIVEAISQAGGYTPMAAENEVTVKRMVGGSLSILKVRAADMAQDPGVIPFEVLPGDIVMVQFRNSTFSILGQVNKPGIYEIPEGSHVNIIEAVLMAGGYTRTAAQNSVTVKRLVAGKPTVFKVKAGDMAQNVELTPFEVLPGDIVKVNESWY